MKNDTTREKERLDSIVAAVREYTGDSSLTAESVLGRCGSRKKDYMRARRAVARLLRHAFQMSHSEIAETMRIRRSSASALINHPDQEADKIVQAVLRRLESTET